MLPGRPMWLGIHWTKMLRCCLVDRCGSGSTGQRCWDVAW